MAVVPISINNKMLIGVHVVLVAVVINCVLSVLKQTGHGISEL